MMDELGSTPKAQPEEMLSDEQRAQETDLENQGEQKKDFALSAGLLFNCRDFAGLQKGIESAISEGPLNLVMLDEYDLTVEEVNQNITQISQIAQNNGLDIVLAPDNGHAQLPPERTPWEKRRNEILTAGAVLLDEHISAEEVGNSVGYFFGKDGSIFAFPKTWEHPIHPIPDTKVAVAICGEIGYLTPEMLKDVDADVIYNPSREGDDPYLKFRMLGVFNPNMTDDEIIAALGDDFHKKLTEGTEEDKANYHNWFLRMKQVIKEEKGRPSNYVRKIADTLKEKGIVVLRSDGESGAGILNPVPGMKINELKYTEDSARLGFSV